MVLLLSACVTAATSGAQAVYSRRSIQTNVNDQYTTMKIFQALNYKTKEFKNANISIATYNNEVLLAGQVPEAWQKVKAEQIVKKIPDIGRVYNLLMVGSPSSTITKISDAWITTKVKTKLIASNDVDASQIKVVTENGMVYLMGIIKPEEADAAIEIASNTDGVQGVVKVFSYIQISKKKGAPIQS